MVLFKNPKVDSVYLLTIITCVVISTSTINLVMPSVIGFPIIVLQEKKTPCNFLGRVTRFRLFLRMGYKLQYWDNEVKWKYLNICSTQIVKVWGRMTSNNSMKMSMVMDVKSSLGIRNNLLRFKQFILYLHWVIYVCWCVVQIFSNVY